MTTTANASAPQAVAVLGATGSIGSSALDVIARHPERYRVFALSAWQKSDELFALCQRFRPQWAVAGHPDKAQALARRLQAAALPTGVLHGEQALCEIAAHADCDTVIAAIVGAAGLAPVLAAAQAGKRILLANKEALVMAGNLLLDQVRKNNASLLPIDSEHNAIFQCLPADSSIGTPPATVERLILTASGGPFLHLPLADFDHITPAMACAHPNWEMGRKISVDSATMMNKVLEIIEARWLFGLAAAKIDAIIHPQSIIHSLVEYCDGSVLAQLGEPDMRTPIACALAWPQRIASGVQAPDFCRLGKLEFFPPDAARFPALALARAALESGGTASAILNAANEEAVSAFLRGQIRFRQITTTVSETLSRLPADAADSLECILAADQQARVQARALCAAA